MIKRIKLDEIPITVYDVEDKKPVLVFTSAYKGDKWFNWHSGAILDYYKRKGKSKTNRFGRVVCFRRATDEQLAKVENGAYAVLDERYSEPSLQKVASGFHSTRIQLSEEWKIRVIKKSA